MTLPPLQGDGPPLELAGLSGPAVVNLWATWCAPCRRELPAFQDVSEQRTDVSFVGVDIGEDPAAAQAFLDELGVTFPQYADEEAELTDALGTAALPVTLIVGDDGQHQHDAHRPAVGRRPARRPRGRMMRPAKALERRRAEPGHPRLNDAIGDVTSCSGVVEQLLEVAGELVGGRPERPGEHERAGVVDDEEVGAVPDLDLSRR